MIGNIPNPFQFRQLIHQSDLNTIFQRQIHRTAALTTAAKPQYRVAIIGNLNQTHFPAVSRKPRIDFVVENIVDPGLPEDCHP